MLSGVEKRHTFFFAFSLRLCGFLETPTVSSLFPIRAKRSSLLLCGLAALREPTFRQTEHSVSRKAAKPQRKRKEERTSLLHSTWHLQRRNEFHQGICTSKMS